MSTTVRPTNGDPDRDVEHLVEPFLKAGLPMPAKTLCERSTAGMELVTFDMDMWPFVCRLCAVKATQSR